MAHEEGRQKEEREGHEGFGQGDLRERITEGKAQVLVKVGHPAKENSGGGGGECEQKKKRGLNKATPFGKAMKEMSAESRADQINGEHNGKGKNRILEDVRKGPNESYFEANAKQTRNKKERRDAGGLVGGICDRGGF